MASIGNTRVAMMCLLVAAHATESALAADDYFAGWNDGELAGWSPVYLTSLSAEPSDEGPGGFLRIQSTDSLLAASATPVYYPWLYDDTPELFDLTGDYASITHISLDLKIFEGPLDSASFRVRYYDGSPGGGNGWSFPIPFHDSGDWESYEIPFDATWSDADAIAAGWVSDVSNVPSFAETFASAAGAEVRLQCDNYSIVDAAVLWVGCDVGVDNLRIATDPDVVCHCQPNDPTDCWTLTSNATASKNHLKNHEHDLPGACSP